MLCICDRVRRTAHSDSNAAGAVPPAFELPEVPVIDSSPVAAAFAINTINTPISDGPIQTVERCAHKPASAVIVPQSAVADTPLHPPPALVHRIRPFSVAAASAADASFASAAVHGRAPSAADSVPYRSLPHHHLLLRSVLSASAVVAASEPAVAGPVF